jgi:hypothetical protein
MQPHQISPAEVAILDHGQQINIDEMKIGENKLRQESAQLDLDQKSLAYFKDLAATLKKSGAIKPDGDSDPEAMAILKMQMGRELGMPAGQSLKDIYITKGAQKMRAAGYTWEFLQHDETVCEMKFYFRGTEVGTCKYTIEDARRAKLVKDDKEDSNWVKTPKNMLYCRNISNAQKWLAPETQGAGYPAVEEMDLENVITATIQSKTEEKTITLAGRLAGAKAAKPAANGEATI